MFTFMPRLGRAGLVLGLAVGLAGVLAPACGDSPVSPSGSPNLRILLTDDFTDDVEEVKIYFTSVTAKPTDGPVQILELELTHNPIDLLTLSDQVIPLAAGVVEPGAYEFIQINIDEDRSGIVESGIEKPLLVPSQEVKVLGGFTVDEEQQTTITLDFDAPASLLLLGNGDWLLKPLIVITGHNASSRP